MNGYFDWNATSPLHPDARAAWLRASDVSWHNPSSLYKEGAAARDLLEHSRERAADYLNCTPEEIIFTSGATEANNALIRWFADSSSAPILFSSLEHPALSDPATAFLGPRAITFPANPDGTTDLNALEHLLITHRPALVSLIAASNETGVLQPWPEALALCRQHGALLHTDASQWIGKILTPNPGIADFVTISAHKFGGPKGIGILKIPDSLRRFRSLRGGPQESSRRAGTENTPAAAAMLAAWDAAVSFLASNNTESLAAPRDSFESSLLSALPNLEIPGRSAPRLWNTSLLLMPSGTNTKWVARLSRAAFQVSTGSACSRGGGASEVLAAMNIHPDRARLAIRVSSGWSTHPDSWSALASAFLDLAPLIS